LKRAAQGPPFFILLEELMAAAWAAAAASARAAAGSIYGYTLAMVSLTFWLIFSPLVGYFATSRN
jgi:hypothetical protein